MSSGAKRATWYIREDTAGETPATGAWKSLLRTSFGLGPTYGTGTSSEIGASRMSQGSNQTTAVVEGDIGQILHYGMQDDFLASVFGNEWDNNTLTLGDERIAFSIASEDTDIGVHGLAKGCQVGALTMSFTADGEIEFTPTFVGLSWDDRRDESFVGTKGAEPTSKRMTFKNITGVRLGGQTLAGAACVDNFSITFDNTMQVQRCVGTGTPWAGANIQTTFAPTGSIVLAWSPLAYDLYAAQKKQYRVPFEFDLSNDEGSYTFSFPMVEISADWPDAGATEITQVTLNIAAAVQPPTITRTPAATDGAELQTTDGVYTTADGQVYEVQ